MRLGLPIATMLLVAAVGCESGTFEEACNAECIHRQECAGAADSLEFCSETCELERQLYEDRIRQGEVGESCFDAARDFSNCEAQQACVGGGPIPHPNCESEGQRFVEDCTLTGLL